MKDLVKHKFSHVEIIKAAMREKGWNAADLSRSSGVSSGVLSRYFNDSGISADNLYAIQRALGLDAPVRRPRPIPVISWVQAGAFAEACDHWPPGVSGECDPVHSVKSLGPHVFALRVEGDSMMPRFMPGDIIVVDPEVKCDNGTACVTWINGEVSLKLFYDGEKEIRLVPMNDRHETRVIPKDSRVDFKIIGKVVDIIAKI